MRKPRERGLGFLHLSLALPGCWASVHQRAHCWWSPLIPLIRGLEPLSFALPVLDSWEGREGQSRAPALKKLRDLEWVGGGRTGKTGHRKYSQGQWSPDEECTPQLGCRKKARAILFCRIAGYRFRNKHLEIKIVLLIFAVWLALGTSLGPSSASRSHGAPPGEVAVERGARATRPHWSICYRRVTSHFGLQEAMGVATFIKARPLNNRNFMVFCT